MKQVHPYYRTNHWKGLRLAALIRDAHTCVVPGCGHRAVVVDHIEARTPTSHPCELDRLDNLRCLCRTHDNQVKEVRADSGERRGEFRVKGCDASGRSLDPKHPWRREE